MMKWLGKKNEKRSGVYGCGRGLVHIIKHHHWPHFLTKLTHHHNHNHLLSTGTTNDSEEEQHKLINVVGEATLLVESAPRKSNSIKARMRALLGEEMNKIKGRQHRQRGDLITHEKEPALPIAEHNNTCYSLEERQDRLLESRPKDYLDALGIISANEEFLVKALPDPGSPLAHHFRNQQALSAKILAKSETFPLPGSSSKRERLGPRPSRLKPNNNKDEEEEDGRVAAIKRFKDLKHKLKHAIRESKNNEMHRVAMDAVIHKIPRGQGETSFQGKGYESDSSDHSSKTTTRLRRIMRRASSFNESLDRYRSLYDMSFKHHTSSEGEGLRRTRLAPKRIYSLPDLKAYDTDQNDESSDAFSCTTRNSLDGQTGQDFPMEIIVEEDSEEKIRSNESEAGLLVKEVTNKEEEEEEEEEEAVWSSSVVEVKEKDKAEFSYVKDILELSGFSGDQLGFLGTWHSDSQPVNPSVCEEAKGCLTLDDDNEDDDYCCETLLFDLINEVLMEIYGRSYSYYPFPLSYLSRTTPMPIGQHVLTQVWGLISFYLSFRTEVDHSVDFVVATDLAKSGNWWMNLQFDCECVGLEDMIFNHLLQQALSD